MKFKVVSDKNRKINLNWDRVNIYVSRWKPGTAFDVEVKRKQKKVSDPLRKYYFSTVLPPYLERLGYEPDEDELFHRQLKIVYFRVEPDEKGIYREKNIPSVFGNNSDLDVSIKLEFTEWVKRKAAQDGVYIPDPNEV